MSAGDFFTLRDPRTSGGHTGFIAFAGIKCFHSLSYQRNMPEKEGLGFNWFCPTEDKHWYLKFQPNWNYNILFMFGLYFKAIERSHLCSFIV